MHIDTAVTTLIACDAPAAFEGASSTETLARIFPGKGPIPGVISAHVVGGGPIARGAVRRVKTKDGNELDETYIQFDRPSGYAYEMSKFKLPLSLLMKKATGTWRFSPEAGGTRIVWTYSVELPSPLAAPFTALIVKKFMKDAMNLCLSILKSDLETHPARA
jgi:Polyketide cyclase / dehydrase and lipid transport